jgi:hypothetical protein
VTDVRPCPLPEGALLSRYTRGRTYTDCYVAELARPASQAEFVEAFYTTFVFRLERFILRCVGRPSTDRQARELAAGTRDSFAAWQVEDRSQDQLLLADFTGNTRSWLMTAPVGQHPGDVRTLLYFGSAVVPRLDARTGKEDMGRPYRVLLGFHKLYSRILLRSARARLLNRPPRLEDPSTSVVSEK